MKFKQQRVRGGLWSALAHVLLFHQENRVSTHEQKRLARRIEERVTNYLCAWKKEAFRPQFRAGEGGAHNIEKYCQTLGHHPLHSNLALELQAFAEIHELDVVMYDRSSNHPDWRTTPTMARAHPFRKGAGRVRILRQGGGAWAALYAVHDMAGGGVRHAKARGGAPPPGPYGQCRAETQCDEDWTCLRQMCVPARDALPPEHAASAATY